MLMKSAELESQRKRFVDVGCVTSKQRKLGVLVRQKWGLVAAIYPDWGTLRLYWLIQRELHTFMLVFISFSDIINICILMTSYLRK